MIITILIKELQIKTKMLNKLRLNQNIQIQMKIFKIKLGVILRINKNSNN